MLTCSAPFISKFTQKNKQNGRHNPLTSKTLARLFNFKRKKCKISLKKNIVAEKNARVTRIIMGADRQKHSHHNYGVDNFQTIDFSFVEAKKKKKAISLAPFRAIKSLTH